METARTVARACVDALKALGATLGCLAVIVLLLAVLVLSTCVSRDVVARAKSPDGSLEAVLSETNGGATTDFAYDVELRPTGALGNWRGARVASLEAASRSDCAWGVDMKWLGTKRLRVSFATSKGGWVTPKVGLDGREVTVEIEPHVNNPAAPCGGMAYNRPRP